MLGLLRGPLTQKASTVQSNVRFETKGDVPLMVAQKLPEGYTGVNMLSRAIYTRVTSRLTPVFNTVMQEYSTRASMTLEYPGCGESCVVTVQV